MNNLLMSYLLPCTLMFALALPSAANARQPDPNAALYRQAGTIVNDARTFDKATGSKTVETFMVPYPTWTAKKTKVTVTTAGKVVRKLTYVAYDEGHTASGTETYYFDSGGKFVCHVNKATGVLSYDVFVDSVLVLWTKPDDPTNAVMRGANAIFQQAANKYLIDYYLGAAGHSNYSTFAISAKNRFRLRVLKDMPLHQSAAAGSATLETLKKGSEVYYVDRSPQPDSVANIGKWVWYKVTTKTAHTGWIWGYPSGIQEATDER